MGKVEMTNMATKGVTNKTVEMVTNRKVGMEKREVTTKKVRMATKGVTNKRVGMAKVMETVKMEVMKKKQGQIIQITETKMSTAMSMAIITVITWKLPGRMMPKL